MPPSSVDYRGTVGGHIDDLRVGRLHANNPLFHNNLLLLRIREITLGIGFGTEMLDGVHDLNFL